MAQSHNYYRSDSGSQGMYIGCTFEIQVDVVSHFSKKSQSLSPHA